MTAPVAAPEQADASPRAGRHLVQLPGGDWSIWSCVCLRGAGFPADTVRRLSSPAAARLALDLLEDRTTRAAATAAFAAETRRVRGVLREIARDPAFREAVIWQTPAAYKHAVSALAIAPVDGVNSATRKKELVVATYVQRYCVKNDSIGFFGPVGWARVCDTAPPIAVTCGPGLVSARNLYFESWCIDAVAHALDADHDLRPWRVPRLAPFVHVEGSRLMIGTRPALDLSPDQLRLLACCDGRRHIKAIARELRSRPGQFPTDEAIYQVVEDWQRAGYVTWTFEGPRELHSERTLRLRLEAIDDASLRARALAPLDCVEEAARRVRQAAGDEEALAQAVEALESTFTTLTGMPPTRAEGQMYAARSLIYEDCRRDVTVELGREVLGRLGPPLSLLLQSARWAVHELARQHEAEFHRIYDDLAGRARRPVALGAFLGRTSLLRTAPGSLSPLAVHVRGALQQRWAKVLSVPQDTRRVQYRSADLRTGVLAAFETREDPPSSWARYLSPDVMIDAPSVDAIQRGECQFVLGEIHVYNTLLQSLFLDQHPAPGRMLEWLEADCPEPRVVWVGPKTTMPHRVQGFLRPNDFAYVGRRDPSPVPAKRTLRIGDLVVDDEAGTLVVRTRDGRRRFTCLEFFGYAIARAGSSLCSLLPPAPHLPRVTIDEVAVGREQWQVAAGEMTFAARDDVLDRYVECQRWSHDRGMPQFVFVKVPTERKPTYIDLSSPVYVELLAKFVRRVQQTDPSGIVTITEMLPTTNGAWLPDAADRRYTSELRLVAFDPSMRKPHAYTTR